MTQTTRRRSRSDGTEATGWHLVQTKPRSEYMAAAALEQNGYDLFFPKVLSPKPRPGRDDMPLFPGYLFVRDRVENVDLPPVGRTAGVVGRVEFDGVIPSVPDEIIVGLRDKVMAMNSDGGYWRRYQPGERVRVTSGKMYDLAEVLEEPASPESRVRVLLQFMGRLVPARVPWSDIQPLNGEPTANGRKKRWPRRTRGKGRWIRGFGPRATPDASTPNS